VHIDLYIALAGLIVGCAVGLTGMGGGALMTPVLVLLFHVQPVAAVASDLVASLVMKPVGAAVHAGRGTVQWGLVAWLTAGSVPSAFLGVTFLKWIGDGTRIQSIVSVTLGVVLLVAVAALGVKMLLDHRSPRTPGVEAKLIMKKAPTLAIGASIGFIVGITSVGSGTLVIILLLFLYPRLRGSQMVGTDLAQAIPMVGSAALAHVLFGDFALGLTASILIGSIPGVLIGAIVSSYAPTLFLRGALSSVLLVSGAQAPDSADPGHRDCPAPQRGRAVECLARGAPERTDAPRRVRRIPGEGCSEHGARARLGSGRLTPRSETSQGDSRPRAAIRCVSTFGATLWLS
jgi:hypothetical protein